MPTANSRRWIVNATLVAVTLWPLVHMSLVWRYDLSTWKLAGWGMYATPRPDTFGMEIYGGPAGSATLEQLVTPSPAMREQATAFLERFRWLRRLASPDDLARAVRGAHPTWSRVRIVVHQTDLDRETGMLVDREIVLEPGL